MKVEANVTRVINERGNQVLIVTGAVVSDNQQGVLPGGKEYDGTFLELEVKGGSLNFSFQVEAGDVVAPVEPLPSELTRQEQDEIYLKSQLKDPNLDATSRFNIEQRLGMSTEAVKSEDKDA